MDIFKELYGRLTIDIEVLRDKLSVSLCFDGTCFDTAKIELKELKEAINKTK